MAQELTDKKEKFVFYNTLLCLAKGLENANVLVDLRNETSISGVITNVDGQMNVTLINATYFEPNRKAVHYESIFIQARQIRDFVIPNQMPIKNIIESQLYPKSKPSTKMQLTFKKSRAVKRQEETKALVANILRDKKQE